MRSGKSKAGDQSPYKGMQTSEWENMLIMPKYLTTEQAAVYCSVSKKTLEHHRQNGTGPQYIKRGRKLVRYTVEALDAWMQAGTVLTMDREYS